MWWCGGDEGLEEGQVDVRDPKGADAVGNVGAEDDVGGEVFWGCGEGRVDEEGVDVGSGGAGGGGGGGSGTGKSEVCEGRGDRLRDLCGEGGGDVVWVDGGRAAGLEGGEFGLDLLSSQRGQFGIVITYGKAGSKTRVASGRSKAENIRKSPPSSPHPSQSSLGWHSQHLLRYSCWSRQLCRCLGSQG